MSMNENNSFINAIKENYQILLLSASNNFPLDNLSKKIIMLPKDLTIEEQVQYILPFLNSKAKSKETLLISNDQFLITYFNHLGLDTCFLNTGLNDCQDYQTTYEISSNQKPKVYSKKEK